MKDVVLLLSFNLLIKEEEVREQERDGANGELGLMQIGKTIYKLL